VCVLQPFQSKLLHCHPEFLQRQPLSMSTVHRQNQDMILRPVQVLPVVAVTFGAEGVSSEPQPSFSWEICTVFSLQ
jgi:hypothetical protein